ncbi:MAG TPA: NUDIX domain-containing protein [Caldilineaceae bacterium]|nr:NUDIX domain-containing protein [Caldilineaceae bacterium]
MSQVLHASDWFSIRTNAKGDEYVASTGDEVLVVALTANGDVLLSIEPSAAFSEPTLILPGGQVEPNVPNAEMANRELQEEIGYRANQLDFLGELHPWSKYLAVRTFVYLARDLQESSLPGNEEYEIGVESVPLSSFETLIVGGRLRDARVIAALFLARTFLQRTAFNGETDAANPTATPTSVHFIDKFDEYKFFIEDTARLSERRQTVNNVYVAVNTILLSAVALLITTADVNRWVAGMAAYAALLGGMAVCLSWRQLLQRYKALTGLRFDELRKMEDLPEMTGCQRMYHVEDRLYPRDGEGQMHQKHRRNFSDLERQLPNIFIGLYIIFVIGTAIGFVVGA